MEFRYLRSIRDYREKAKWERVKKDVGDELKLISDIRTELMLLSQVKLAVNYVNQLKEPKNGIGESPSRPHSSRKRFQVQVPEQIVPHSSNNDPDVWAPPTPVEQTRAEKSVPVTVYAPKPKPKSTTVVSSTASTAGSRPSVNARDVPRKKTEVAVTKPKVDKNPPASVKTTTAAISKTTPKTPVKKAGDKEESSTEVPPPAANPYDEVAAEPPRPK